MPPRADLYDRADQKARVADRSATGRQPGPAPADRANDVFAGPDGNVYRRDRDGSWEQREGSTWKPADPGKIGGGDRPSTRPAEPPSGSRPAQPSTRPAQPPTGSLNRDYSARQRGSAQTNNFNRSRSMPSGGMGGRGGGGRRR